MSTESPLKFVFVIIDNTTNEPLTTNTNEMLARGITLTREEQNTLTEKRSSGLINNLVLKTWTTITKAEDHLEQFANALEFGDAKDKEAFKRRLAIFKITPVDLEAYLKETMPWVKHTLLDGRIHPIQGLFKALRYRSKNNPKIKRAE